jgi:hypothetical protein
MNAESIEKLRLRFGMSRVMSKFRELAPDHINDVGENRVGGGEAVQL